jgi:hypothetical protein
MTSKFLGWTANRIAECSLRFRKNNMSENKRYEPYWLVTIVIFGHAQNANIHAQEKKQKTSHLLPVAFYTFCVHFKKINGQTI